MKKLLYTILFIFSIAILISCDDDAFLEEQPKDIFTPENAFTSSKQVDDQLITAYLEVASRYADTWWLGIGADLFDWEDYVAGMGSRGNSNYGRYDGNSFNGQWTDLYQIASYANLAIAGSETVEWASDSEKNLKIAEAKFFLGWAYLRLGEMYGGVPIVEEYSEALKLDYTRSTRDETYQFAIDMLSAAASGLPQNALESGRVDKDVANHYLAEAYLAKGDYDNAISAASSVITNHPLMTERFGVRANPSDGGSSNGVPNYREDGNVFYDLFRKGNYDAPENTESIWVAKSADYDLFMSYSTGSGWFGPRSDVRAWSNQANFAPVFRDLRWKEEYQEEGAAAHPWTGNLDLDMYPGGQTGPYCGGFSIARGAPTKYLAYKIWGLSSWEDEVNGLQESSVLWDDMRNSEIVYSREHLCIDKDHSLYGQPIRLDKLVQRSDGDMQLFPLTCKYFNREDLWGFEASVVATGGANIYARDMYMVRSAETYLIRAEAYLMKGQGDMAAADINALRQRAQCSKLFAGGEVNINTILDERARELAFEENRWATLLRIGGSTMQNQLLNNAKYTADWPTYTGAISWELLPIPQDAVIDINLEADIAQNPGWE